MKIESSALAMKKPLSPAALKGFNPQPDPPGKLDPNAGSIIICGKSAHVAAGRLAVGESEALGGPDTAPATVGAAKTSVLGKLVAALRALVNR